MDGRINGKLKILYIIDILRKYSDEQNPINATEICGFLSDYGIKAERKAIYDDIEHLIFYGYDIIKTRTPKSGFFLASRELEIPEIYLLTDAVQSAGFITPKKTRELVSKLGSMMSAEQVRVRNKSTYIEYKNKCANEEIYISIDTVRQAIESGKKISLKYFKRVLDESRKITTEEKQMKVSPYALMWVEDHYYLVCNNEKYDNLMHLRLDRMKTVRILDEDFRHFSEVSSYKDAFDIADYAGKTFNMFGGELKEIELLCSTRILDQVLDRFSDNLFIKDVTKEKFRFSHKALISEGLVSWLLQFGEDIEVLSPLELREKIKEKIDKIRQIY